MIFKSNSFVAAFAAFSLLCAVSANAVVVHESDYEAETMTGFGVAPSTMGFSDGGGDVQGFSNGDLSGGTIGVSDANPNSGAYHYALDTGVYVGSNGWDGNGDGNPDFQGNGWGGTWSGQDTNGGSGGFAPQADVEAAGVGCYVDLVGATVTATVQVATDMADPLSGGATAEIRLEFNGATPDIIPRAVSGALGAADLTAAYQPLTISYTLTAAEVAMGIDRVVAVIGTNGHNDGTNGSTPSDGMIYFDDFVFEINDENVVCIPEPASAGLLISGLLAMCGIARRRS